MDMPSRRRVVIPLQEMIQISSYYVYLFFSRVTTEVLEPYVTGLMRI